MSRYVVKPRSRDPRAEEIAAIEGLAGVTVVERAGRALLVEASGEAVDLLRDRLPGWTVAPEVTFPPPS